MDIFVLVGYVGVTLMLLSYFLLVIGHMKVTDTPYIVMNVLGALLVFVTLYTGGTLSFLHIIALWLLISVFGFYKHHIATTA